MPFVDYQRTSYKLRCPYSMATSILNTNAQSSPHSFNMSTHYQSVRCPSIANEPTPFNSPRALTCLVVADSGIYSISPSHKPISWHSRTLREPVINCDFLTHQQPVSWIQMLRVPSTHLTWALTITKVLRVIAVSNIHHQPFSQPDASQRKSYSDTSMFLHRS